GLFMETVRDPAGFVAALEKANHRQIPIVAVKLGRTETGARMAQSHSGAMAGFDAAYEALFDRYGVVRVDTIDQLATALTMFAQPHPVGPGGLVTIHDSGGERALIIDLADRAGVPFADLAPDTLVRMKPLLGPGLPVVNPLDAWDTSDNYSETIVGCLGAMMADPATSVGAMIGDRSPGGGIWSDYRNFLAGAQADTGKPVFLVSNHQGTGSDPLVFEMTREGLPVLDGVGSFLEGVRCLFEYRDHQARPAMAPPAVADGMAERWRHRLGDGPLDTSTAMELLGDFAIPTIPTTVTGDRDGALTAAEAMGYPVALKTAELAIAHKTEVGGVHLGLGGRDAVAAAYDDLAARLGAQVAVSPMAQAGVEMILGVINDPQFGPIVMIGTGGVHAETIGDALFALPPFDAAWARRLVDRLALRALLDGVRGAPPADIDGLCRAAAHLSVLAAVLGDAIGEIDINPLIVGPRGCLAVDALVVPASLRGVDGP
ncbi:MAG: acetate--CoA ligase family protein, partial [Alphaproteobacteria bacterium]